MAFTTDNELWQILISELNLWAAQFFIDFGATVTVARNFQPQQFDVPEGLVLFISKIHSIRYGTQSRSDTYDNISGLTDHIERYILNETFQIDTQATSNPNQTVSDIRSADVAENVAAYLNSLKTVNSLKSQGIEIFRIRNIRHGHFLNDFNRFESAPSFDFTLSYTQEILTQEPPVEAILGNLYPI